MFSKENLGNTSKLKLQHAEKIVNIMVSYFYKCVKTTVKYY